MPIALTLVLTSDSAATLPAHLGRAHYAAALARLNQADPALVQQIHDGDGPKPLTCSGLLNARSSRDGMEIRAGESYYLRMTGLTDAVSAALRAALLDDPPATWELDHHPFRVEQAICDADADAWSGHATYEELAAAQLLQPGQLRKSVTLRFSSPTAFKSKGMTINVPLPGLVFGSLVERWNAFSPVTLSPEVRRFGEEMVAVSSYNLQSVTVQQKGKGKRIGGVGVATYHALGGDRYWLATMQMLADFALYSGVGVQTTTGMGQVRRIR